MDSDTTQNSPQFEGYFLWIIQINSFDPKVHQYLLDAWLNCAGIFVLESDTVAVPSIVAQG